MKKHNILGFSIILSFLFLLPPSGTFASYQGGKNIKNKKPRLNKTMDNPAQSVMDINNITCWVGQEGFHDWVVGGGSWNGSFPAGSNLGVIFSEGLVWGGQVHDGSTPVVRVDGNTYLSGTKAITRLYRVRPDYKTGDLTKDAAAFFSKSMGAVTTSDIQALRDQYAKDWKEWPADKGAPYDDVNGDGTYEPDTDIPGIPGAAQTLFIKYDDSNSPTAYGSPPIGLEVRETYWAYSYSGALGNVIYKKVDFVYKGTANSAANSEIDSLYIVQWVDPDVGNYNDDFAGCDTTLNLGYAYSSGTVDADYSGLGFTPAVGYDFQQGVSVKTGVSTDSAMFDLKWRHGYKYVNVKPMSSFIYFAAGGTWGDPDFDYNGTLQFYNLMRGSLPRPPYPTYTKFPASVVDYTPYGAYLVDGDPVAGTGKLDGTVDGPGDRRIMVVNGPVTLSIGDTAQVVVALVGGLGTTNINAVAEVKKNDNTAQIVFDQLFKLPSIKPPVVKLTNLHNSVVLNWGVDPESINKIESFSSQGYNFEGYEVYQLPSASASLKDGKLIGIYDINDGVTAIYDTVADQNGILKPVLTVSGKDNGITRFQNITTDQFTKQELKDGQSYYFAVVSYAYNPAPLLPFHALMSSVNIIQAVPQEQTGIRTTAAVGDTVASKHKSGKSNGSVFALVVDPTATTGDTYKVTFDTLNGGYVWNLTDATKSKVLLPNQTNQSGDNNYPIVDGILTKVIGPPLAINHWSYSGTRWVSGTNWGGAQFFGGMDLGINFFGSTVTPSQYVPVELRWVGGSVADTSEANGWSRGAVYRRDLGYTFDGTGWLPFTAWDVSDPSNPRQLNICFVEDANNGSANHLWDMGWDGSNFAKYGGREYIFIMLSDYDAGAEYNNTNWGPVSDVLYAIWPHSRGSHPYLQAPFTMEIVPNYINLPSDVFEFTAPEVKSGPALVKDDLKKINVFPNPYYGYQYRETSREQHYVTFNHLPPEATIRIFDLSGVLVKTIHHIPASGQFDTWNLKNESNLPVASGIYIAYIDMPKYGMTKVLKIAIIQEQQILKVY